MHASRSPWRPSMCWSSGTVSNLTRRASCPSRWRSLVCKIPISLLSLSETNTIGYYVLRAKPPQRYPLHSGRALKTFEAARLQAYKLSQQGYSGWILRVQEVRQEDWPDDHWRI